MAKDPSLERISQVSAWFEYNHVLENLCMTVYVHYVLDLSAQPS